MKINPLQLQLPAGQLRPRDRVESSNHLSYMATFSSKENFEFVFFFFFTLDFLDELINRQRTCLNYD